MFRNKKRLVCTVLCTVMLLGMIGPPPMFENFLRVDAVSAATGGGAVTPPNPKEYEDEPGVSIPEEDKNLPYDEDFVLSYEYNNPYGFVIMSINEDMLDGNFVNAITHIGINDTKYTYETVNKDKASWFRIFVPYKYINKGENDLYFYLEGITYKVRFVTSDEFHKVNIAPTLIPHQVVPGTDELMKISIKHDDNAALEGWYDAFKPEYVRISEIFTMGDLTTVINPQNYQVTLDREEGELNIQFNNYDINQLYVYKLEIEVPDYTITYRDIILHEAPPTLQGEWQTAGNNSFRITVVGEEYSLYLRELSKVTLINGAGESVELKKGKDYSAKLGLLEIFASVFESGEDYTIVLDHGTAATNEITTTAPTLSSIDEVVLFIDDVEKGNDVTFSHDNSDWLANITKIQVHHFNLGYSEVPDYSIGEDGTITIPANHFKQREKQWTIIITSAGYGDVSAPVYIKPQPGPFNFDTPPVITADWETMGNYDYLIQEKDEKYSTYLYLDVSRVFLLDKTTGEVKELKKDRDYSKGYTLRILPAAFVSGHEYEIKLVSSAYETSTVTTTTPDFPSIKEPSATVGNIAEGHDVIIESDDEDWINAVSSVTIRDERGFDETVTELNKSERSIRIPASVINDSNIQRTVGQFTIQIAAAEYEEYQDTFFVLKNSVMMKQGFENGKVKLFFEEDGLPEYGFSDSITKIILNGRALNPSEYMRPVTGTLVYISEKLLLDGANTILVEGNHASVFSVAFDYDNDALRTLKSSLESLITSSQLGASQKGVHLGRLNEAKTVKEANAIKIQVEKEISSLTNNDNSNNGNNNNNNNDNSNNGNSNSDNSNSGNSNKGNGNSNTGRSSLPKQPETIAAGSSAIVGGTTTEGKTVASIKADEMDKLVASAKTAQEKGNSGAVEIKMKAGSETTSIALNIPASSLASLAKNTDAGLKIDAGIATVSFDANAVNAISSAASSGEVCIGVSKADTSKLNVDSQSLIGHRPVYSLSVTAGNTEVTSFGKGKAMVRIPYTLEANEDSNAVVIYYIDGNGAAQVARGAYNSSTKTVDFVSSHFSQYAIGYNKVDFNDVAPDAWYHAAVTFNASRGVVSGTSDVTFRPNTAITRGQFIVMLLRAYGIEPDAGSGNNFADAGNTYYTSYLAKAKEMGITTGIGDNLFAPEGNITRQDMLTMLYRALDTLEELPEAAKSTNLSDFSDVNLVGDYSRDAITALVQAGVVSGNQGKIEPQGQSTRAQMAQLLYNLLSL